MTWDYRKFPSHPVAAEKLEMRVRNTIIYYYLYRFDTELGKCVCAIHRIKRSCPSCVAQLDKYWLPTISPSSQPRHAHFENCYYSKIIEHCNDWIIMKFLDNKKTQVEFDKLLCIDSCRNVKY